MIDPNPNPQWIPGQVKGPSGYVERALYQTSEGFYRLHASKHADEFGHCGWFLYGPDWKLIDSGKCTFIQGARRHAEDALKRELNK